MSKLNLSVALCDYDRTRPIFDGRVQIDGVNPICQALSPEEIFFRAFRHAEFDISELSLSSFAARTAAGECAYVGVPVFLSRAFRHTSFYVRKDRIAEPGDLIGKRIGVAEYQLSANVWARAILADYGVRPSDVIWIQGGLEEAGRVEKTKVSLPSDVRLETVAPGETLSALLADGKIDAIITPRMPSCHGVTANVGWLFDDPTAVATDWYRRTGMFPIMHLVGVRRTLVEEHPWLPGAVYKAFTQAKSVALAQLSDTSSTKVTLPFVEDQLVFARNLMGDDFWPYGLASSHGVLEFFLRHHHAQGLSQTLLSPQDLFHPTTHESFKL